MIRSVRPRILPLTLVAVSALLAMKLADVARGGREFARMFTVGNVEAESKTPPQPPTPPQAPAPPADAKAPAEAPKAEEKVAEKPQDKAAEKVPEKPAEKPVEKSTDAAGKPPAEPAKPEAAAGKPAEATKEGDEKKPAPVPGVSTTPPEEPEGAHALAPGSRILSPTEMDILDTLQKRHEQLDGWRKDLEVKENLLSVTEKRVDDKLAQVDTMKKELQEMIAQYNTQEDSKIKSLVKIYETMKPRDAARIFDEVEMPILLLVIDRMKEKNAAPILANMDPKKAKQLTVELAEQRRIQTSKLSTAKQVAAPAAKTP